MVTYSNVILYVLIWWMVLFVVLPLGLKPAKNVASTGYDQEAATPRKAHLPLKFLITTILAGGFWHIAKWVIDEDLFGIGR